MEDTTLETLDAAEELLKMLADITCDDEREIINDYIGDWVSKDKALDKIAAIRKEKSKELMMY